MKKSLIISLLFIFMYLGLLFFPKPLFTNFYEYKNFTVYSDREIPKEIENVLDEAQDRTGCNKHDSRVKKYKIFLCNAEWRLKFFTWNYILTMYVNDFSSNIFVEGSDIKKDKLLRPLNSKTRYKNDELSEYIALQMYVLRYRRLMK